MSKMIPYENGKKVYDAVLAVDLDSIQAVHNERPYQKEFAQQVRTFLKTLGFSSRQISVKSATGSMCYWIEVRLPYIDTGMTHRQINALSPEEANAFFESSRVMSQHRHVACRHMNNIIARAFPGCADRSDSMSDYYDFMYIVH